MARGTIYELEEVVGDVFKRSLMVVELVSEFQTCSGTIEATLNWSEVDIELETDNGISLLKCIGLEGAKEINGNEKECL